MTHTNHRPISSTSASNVTGLTGINRDEWVTSQVVAFRSAADGTIGLSVKSLTAQLENEFRQRIEQVVREMTKRGDAFKEKALNNGHLVDTLRSENNRLKDEIKKVKHQALAPTTSNPVSPPTVLKPAIRLNGDPCLRSNADGSACTDKPDGQTAEYQSLLANHNALLANHRTLESAFVSLNRKFKEAKMAVQLWRDYFEKKHNGCCQEGVEAMKQDTTANTSPNIPTKPLSVVETANKELGVVSSVVPILVSSGSSESVSQSLPPQSSPVILSDRINAPNPTSPSGLITPVTLPRKRAHPAEKRDDRRDKVEAGRFSPFSVSGIHHPPDPLITPIDQHDRRNRSAEEPAFDHRFGTIPSSQATEGEQFVADGETEDVIPTDSQCQLTVKVKADALSQIQHNERVVQPRWYQHARRTEGLDLDFSSQLETVHNPAAFETTTTTPVNGIRKRRRVGPASSPPPVPSTLRPPPRMGSEPERGIRLGPASTHTIHPRNSSPIQHDRPSSTPPEDTSADSDHSDHYFAPPPISLLRTNSTAGRTTAGTNTSSATKPVGITPHRIGVLHPLGANRGGVRSPQTRSGQVGSPITNERGCGKHTNPSVTPLPDQSSRKPREGAQTLRNLPLSALKLSDFRINPTANGGFTHAYTETVRGNSRKSMRGCVDPRCCGKEFKALAEAADDHVFDRLLNTSPREGQSNSHITVKAGDGSKVHLSRTEWGLVHRYLGLDAESVGGESGPENEEAYSLTSHIASLPDPAAVEDFVMASKISILADAHGRKHRDRFRRRGKTPPGFWDAGFPDTQEEARRRAEQEGERASWESEEIELRAAEARGRIGQWVFRDEL